MSPSRRRAVVTAPGKLILLGEHSVVYGGAALVAALGMKARVEARTDRDGIAEHSVEVELRDLGIEVRESWEALAQYAVERRQAWEAYARDPGPDTFRRVRGTDPAHLARVALGEVALELGGGAGLPALALSISSEIPIGSGFGSSAALAAAVPAATLAALGNEPTVERLARLALEVERRQHGSPSGADHNAVLRGGLVRIERRPGGELSVTQLEADRRLLERFHVYDTGAPTESTGEVVAAVRALRDRDPEAFEARLGRMMSAVDRFAAALVPVGRPGAGDPAMGEDALADTIREFEAALEELGVVPASVRAWIRRLEARGAAAKLSGAGALSEGGAGSLIVYRPAGCPSLARELAGLAHHAVELGAEGLHVEVIE